jgi:hypothetical protein
LVTRVRHKRLVNLVVQVPSSNVALVGKEQIAAQRVRALPLVELPPNAPAEFFVGDVAA